jgi:hypothetical protein
MVNEPLMRQFRSLRFYQPLTIHPAKVCLAATAGRSGCMAITDFPPLSMLRTKMEWHQERQRVRAEYVANADIANYQARDLTLTEN